jgi:hypothetical protein
LRCAWHTVAHPRFLPSGVGECCGQRFRGQAAYEGGLGRAVGVAWVLPGPRHTRVLMRGEGSSRVAGVSGALCLHHVQQAGLGVPSCTRVGHARCHLWLSASCGLLVGRLGGQVPLALPLHTSTHMRCCVACHKIRCRPTGSFKNVPSGCGQPALLHCCACLPPQHPARDRPAAHWALGHWRGLVPILHPRLPHSSQPPSESLRHHQPAGSTRCRVYDLCTLLRGHWRCCVTPPLWQRHKGSASGAVLCCHASICTWVCSCLCSMVLH